MSHIYNKKEALSIIISSAKAYHNLLENNNFLFLYRNRTTNLVEHFEAVFLPRHFQHLTGIDYVNPHTKIPIKNVSYFYNKCLTNNITEAEIRLRTDGTTHLKLEALPKLVHFLHFSKMTVTYNRSRPRLSVDRFAGTSNFCLGFTQDGNYYMPSSCILGDIRDFGNNPSQILAISQRPNTASSPIYNDIRYVAKGVPLDKLTLPDDLMEKISFENYTHKSLK